MDLFSGRSVPGRDTAARISGAARYVGDLSLPGMLHGVTVRSTQARARIAAIEFDPSFPWQECTVVTASGIPGVNCIAHILEDQPCLAASEVHHAAEPILLIAHPDRYKVEEARRAVRIVYEPLPPLFDPERSTQLFKEYHATRGDLDAAFASNFVFEGEYHTAANDQVYIEPQGMLAAAAPQGGITVWGSMQCPYYVHHALQRALALPADKVRVVQCETGGGFGGKEDYPSVIACHAALLALNSGRPVRLLYDRAEDLEATTKRHPSRTRLRTAVSPDGILLGIDVDFLIDGGAYTTLSPVVLSRGLIHSTGPYFCPNIRLHGRAVATNHPPHGAFRGFGVPQSCFAIERHLDRLALHLRLAPDEIRRRNLLRAGQSTATGQIMRPDLDLVSLLDRSLAESQFHSKRAAAEAHNRTSPVKRGIGLSCSFHGAGFTGSGERVLHSEVRLKRTASGRLRVLVSSVDMGQGATTVLAQIAADAYGCSLQDVEMAPPDTALVPNSGPTVASRTTMIVGDLVARCARQLRASGAAEATVHYEPPTGAAWDDTTFSGEAYADYSWAIDVAETEVDGDTGEVRLQAVTALIEAGRIVNPVLAAGQVEGGIVQGAGYALTEETIYQEGRVINGQMTNTIIPTAADAPSIHVVFVTPPSDATPKGLGELALNGVAPAILNAIAHATGADCCTIPATPERVLEALHG